MTLPAPQAAHWSKDFVEHLRTVHFTLIALCVGLGILAVLPSQTEIQRAHDQVAEILRVTNEWDSNLVLNEIRRLQTEFIKANNQDEFIVDETDVSPQFALAVDSTHGKSARLFTPDIAFVTDWTLNLGFPSELHKQKPPLDAPRLDFLDYQAAVSEPPNLKLFALLWDDLVNAGKVTFPTSLVKSCVAFRITLRRKHRKLTREECNVLPRGDHDRLPLEFLSSKRFLDDIPNNLASSKDTIQFINGFAAEGWFAEVAENPVSEDIEEHVVAMPARNFVTMPIDGHNLITRLSPKWRQKYKLRFKDAFPELASVDEPFENADLGSAERILRAEANRTGDAFEAAGLKIPAEAAIWCGILLIFGIQVYMLIHLREFGNRVDREAGFEIAWIGVYTSRLARWTLFVSLLVLPAFTVTLLSRRVSLMIETQWLRWALAVVSNCASITVAFLIFRALPDPHASSPSPKPEQTCSPFE